MTHTLYRREIESAAGQYYLDANLVEALVICESAGRADAFRFEEGFYEKYLKNNHAYDGQIPRRISSSYGLCQVMYTTALEYGIEVPEPEYLFIPSLNLVAGCTILHDLTLWARNDLGKALAGYNGGKGGFRGEAPKRYAQKVLAKLAEIQAAKG